MDERAIRAGISSCLLGNPSAATGGRPWLEHQLYLHQHPRELMVRNRV